MNISSIGAALTPASPGTSPKDTPEKMHDAASQFEALMIGQILKSAQGEKREGWGEGEDASSGSAVEFANDFFARSLAQKGGLGLAHMITTSLAHASNSSPATPDSSAPGIPKAD